MKDIRKAVEGFLSKGQPVPIKPPEPQVDTKKRTLGSVYVALEAQRIYSPNMPAVPKPMSPKKPEDLGTAPNLDTAGRWGTGEK